ncbi:unnamed protein product [Larinioides sclopetarius]|uniref:Uncharacterized protein n=1 Tax=Larinioides sclopetarius TaxID=280406 RepID=A0AAV2BT89_9ARAC
MGTSTCSTGGTECGTLTPSTGRTDWWTRSRARSRTTPSSSSTPATGRSSTAGGPTGQQLFLVNGPDLWHSQSVSADHGLVMDIESGLPMTLWGPDKGFRLPHDLSVSPDGKYVYVSDIDLSAPKRVYKFNIRD